METKTTENGKPGPQGEKTQIVINWPHPETNRNENDIDSITVGSPSKKQVKIYANTKTETLEQIQARIETVVNAAEYAERLLQGIKNGGLE